MARHSPPQAGPARILIVEARQDARSPLRQALECAGHQVGEAGNLAAAREALSHGAIELVLYGIHLGPGESGLALLRELAPRAPDVAVVMLSGDHDMLAAMDCLRDGAFDCVTDPSQPQELQEIIARALRRQRWMIAQRQGVEEQVRILSQFPSENPNPVFRVTRDGLVLYANASSQTILGQLNCKVGEKSPPFLRQFIADFLEKGERGEAQIEVAGRTFSFALTAIQDADYFYLYGHDITRLKETERELVRLKEEAQAMALHDALTGLPNRTLVRDRLAQAIAHCVRFGKKLAVVFIDLDNFKQINDAHGHQVGDQILVEVARCISAAVRKTDTVGRWGGDEFILLLPGLNDSSDAGAVCERVKRIAQEGLAGNPLASPLTLSMGIALYPDDASLAELLLQQADTALYRAKGSGRNVIAVFGESG